jgi:hypothetical protein
LNGSVSVAVEDIEVADSIFGKEFFGHGTMEPSDNDKFERMTGASSRSLPQVAW